MEQIYDVIIVGGGPAGLNAALILGRCRRSVVVCDAGRGRNWASHAMHGYLSRDGLPPSDLRRLGQDEIKAYGVDFCPVRVVGATREEYGFEVTLDGASRLRSRKLLLATGVCDRLPRIEGIEKYYGKSVFHCPYCDGWEQTGKQVGVYGKARQGLGLALSLKTWSEDVVLFTDGAPRLSPEERERLRDNGIGLREERISGLEGKDGILEGILLRSGDTIARQALFFSTGQVQQSELPKLLGCEFNSKGTVKTSRFQETSVPGLYVAGDAARDVQMVIVAAAEGCKAGIAINTALQKETLR